MPKISVGNTLWLAVGILTGMACAFVVGFNPVIVTVDKEAGQIWPAWVQAIGSIGAILVTGGTAIFLFLRQKADERRKELAHAKIHIAFAFDDLSESLWELSHVIKLTMRHRGETGTLEDVMEATSLTDSFHTTLKASHAFPELTDYMTRYMQKANALHSHARNSARDVGTPNLALNTFETIFREMDELTDIGIELQRKMLEIQDADIH